MSYRLIIRIQCPGNRQSAAVLAVGPATLMGVGNPKNTRDCPLSIAGETKCKKLLHPNLVLRPGESEPWFIPPAGTHRILVAGFSDRTGEAILEYDTPIT